MLKKLCTIVALSAAVVLGAGAPAATAEAATAEATHDGSGWSWQY